MVSIQSQIDRLYGIYNIYIYTLYSDREEDKNIIHYIYL